jgi:hypothetical protein
MAAYDPKRNRPSRAADDDAPAQVDALLEPQPEPTVDLREAEPVAEPERPEVTGSTAPRPVPPVLAPPPPDRNTQRVAVVAGLAAATAAAFVIWRRSRRRR